MNILLIFSTIAFFIGIAGAIITLKRSVHIVPPGSAVIRSGMGGPLVSFTQIVAFPGIHQIETLDIALKTVTLNRAGSTAIICKDHLRMDIRVRFLVRINPTSQDVLKVAQSLGCRRTADNAEIVRFFEPIFGEAVKTVAYRYTLRDMIRNSEAFKEDVIQQIGLGLNGYLLDEMVIEEMSQTPVSKLDPQNILDAEGIRKITVHLNAMDSRTVHDITFPISENLTVWPNDPPVSLTHNNIYEQGSRVMVSRLVLNSHAGTHMDAPSHFLEDGKHVDALDLRTLIGPCEVVQTSAAAITEEVLSGMNIPERTTRLLIKTQNSARFGGTEPFFHDYVGLTTSGARWLLAHGVALVGIDYLTISKEGEERAVHEALLKAEVVLLETLDLRDVTPGPYRLVALPLRLKDTDGSPIRAVLLSMD